MASEMFGDEYEADWKWGTPNKCPKCGNRGRYSEDEKPIWDVSPHERDKGIDPPSRWEDGRRRYICCECGHIDHAIEFKVKGE